MYNPMAVAEARPQLQIGHLQVSYLPFVLNFVFHANQVLEIKFLRLDFAEDRRV